MSESEDAQLSGANNPASRVAKFLRHVQKAGRGSQQGNKSVTPAVEEYFGMSLKESRGRIERQLADLKIEAYRVEDLMEPILEDEPWSVAVFAHYKGVLQSAAVWQNPSTSVGQFLSGMKDPAWIALDFAAQRLERERPEPTLTVAEREDYLEQVQQIISGLASASDGESMTRADRKHIIDLLRDVEDALIRLKVTGTTDLEKAALVLVGDAVAHRDLWDRVADNKWVQRVGKVIGGLFMIFQRFGGYQALSAARSDLFPPELMPPPGS